MFRISFFLCLFSSLGFAQIKKDTSDLTFTGTRINPYDIEYDTSGHLKFSGYIDTYYSYYTDSLGPDGYSKFPTAAPRHNQFGLNIAQFGVKYQAERLRGVATIFFGDSPSSAWSPYLNYIQEANAGFRIWNKLWLDAGFFRTHIGLESIQPRENITTSFAITTYYEPYYMSGAKLTWQQSQKWTFQVNAFNGYNNFIENNDNKAVGVSIAFIPNDRWSHTLSSIVSDEYPKDATSRHLRHYTNFVSVYKGRKVTLGFDANFGYQENSKLKDTTQTAWMFSAIAAAKYRMTERWGIYGRGELFSDPDEMLTGPVEDYNHTLVGLDILGATGGIEYKPIPNAYLRIESRLLRTKESELIFYYNKSVRNYRWEGIISLGTWF